MLSSYGSMILSKGRLVSGKFELVSMVVYLSPSCCSCYWVSSSLGELFAASMELTSQDSLCSPRICRISHFNGNFITWCSIEGLHPFHESKASRVSLTIPLVLVTSVISPRVISPELLNPESSRTLGMTQSVSFISSIARNWMMFDDLSESIKTLLTSV